MTAANLVVKSVIEAVSVRDCFHLVLSGGSTPKTLYKLLAEEPFRSQIPWPVGHIFWADERLVPPDNIESNYKLAWDLFLEDVPLKEENLHRMKGEAGARQAVSEYSKLLRGLAEKDRDWPHFDVVLLGLGADGHTASLFPGPISKAEKSNGVIAAKAAYQNRPADRITLTPLVLNEARQITFLAAGSEKAEAVRGSLGKELDPKRWPAQRINPPAGKVTWIVDQAAAGSLGNSRN